VNARTLVWAVVCLGSLLGVTPRINAQTLPTPWSHRDIGSPPVAGSASESAGTFTVNGAGTDIGGSSDQFHFVYQPFDGDMEIIARVVSLQNTHPWAKAGVMIRESLSAPAAHAFMAGTGKRGWAFQRRPVMGGTSIHTAGESTPPPGWVRLVRSGDTFTAYESTDGSKWVLVGTDTIPMPRSVYVGLAVTSHDARRTTRATFSNLTVTGAAALNEPPSVILTAPADRSTFAAPASIAFSATAADKDGTVARVDFYANGRQVGSDSASPYAATWNSVPAGTYTLTAIATDDEGASTTSGAATVTVSAAANQPPTSTITSPAGGAGYLAPATISITASAADSDGTIAGVDFYSGAVLIGTDSSSPYSVTWSNVAAGTYTLTAVARDNGGASTRSAAVGVTVTVAPSSTPVVFVQQAGMDAGTVSSATRAFPSPNATGNFVAVIVRAGGLDKVLTITDTNGNQYRRAVQFNVARDGVSFAIFYAENIVGGPNSVRVSVSSQGTLRFSILEYAGVAKIDALDGTGAAEGSGTTATSGTVITIRGGLRIGAIMTANPASITAGSGYTLRSAVPPNPNAKLAVEDSVQSAGGAVSATATLGKTDVWGVVFAAFASGAMSAAAPDAPTTLAFNPSPDHDTGVSSYSVALYRAGDPVTAATVAARNLGKPTPVNNDITVNISDLVNALPTGSYYAVVSAIGPGGTSPSSPSATFTK
jgi:regulation of enolase protein 1 (concanavalin A-like superfamily)